MNCNFCGGPAHPATGCQYGEATIACRSCVLRFWEWVKKHTNGKAKRPRKRSDGTTQPVPALTFYEHAGRNE